MVLYYNSLNHMFFPPDHLCIVIEYIVNQFGENERNIMNSCSHVSWKNQY